MFPAPGRTLPWTSRFLLPSTEVSLFTVVSDSSRPHGLQPTRLLRAWDFPGKSTGVECHRLLCSNEYSGSISFRMDWFDLLAVQGTLKSLLQHHSLKAPRLWCSAFFMVQLSYLYMTTGKTIALTILTFVGKVMSLLFKHCLVWS